MNFLPWMIGANLLIGASTGNPRNNEQGLSLTNLRCEYLVNPLGIDALRPRLSWVLQSDRRGEKQTAYQILASGSLDRLTSDQGDLWDSGRVVSGESVHVVYDGAKLTSGQRVYWKVRVWDKDGRPSPFSAPAWWEMGLLQRQDWKGSWIAAPLPQKTEETTAQVLQDARWIGWPRSLPRADREGQPEKTFFRYVLDLPDDRKVTQARFSLTADHRFFLFINEARVGYGRQWSYLHRLEIASYLRPGKNILAVEAHKARDVAGLIGSLVIEFEKGEPMTIVTDRHWKTTDREREDWKKLDIDDHDWIAAEELGSYGVEPWKEIVLPVEGAPAPHFRRVYRLDKPIRSARAYICGLGYHELYINGRKVGQHVLDPAFTRYDKRALYVTHDVTDYLVEGDNAIGVVLGNGWYNMHLRGEWDFDMAPWRAEPCFLLQIVTEDKDGKKDVPVFSDESWRVAAGPIVFDCIRAGEVYDARREMPGWNQVDFDAAAFHTPRCVTSPTTLLRAQQMPAIEVTQTIAPVKLTEPRPGVFVFDLGQNIAGWARLSVQGPAGTEINLKYGERLRPDGTIDQEAIAMFCMQDRFQRDTYILKGQGLETYEPRFVYHGFQYVEVTGLPEKPTLNSLRGRVVHTAFKQVGLFRCSHELFNQIQHNTLWSYIGNFHGYPTDCPHREKNGWTGDAALASELAMYNFDNVAAYEKWINDFEDARREDGAFPGIVPTSGWGYHWGNGPAWDSAYLIIPWNLYQYYGDRRVLEDHYEGMKAYVDYLTGKAKDHIVSIGLGDWCPAKTQTPVEVTSTGYYFADAEIVARTARLLGHDEDAERYGQLANRIKEAFNRKFFDEKTGLYAGGTQAAMACALYWGLVPDAHRQRVVDALSENIKAQNGHLDAGILGTKYLINALTDLGRADLVYTMASQTTFPSWGHWIAQGATTLWEEWQGGGSRNHIMFGDISAWFYKALAGINPDPQNPGFAHIIVRPHILGDLTHAEAQYDSIRGRMVSKWTLEQGVLTLDLKIPANTKATLYVPLGKADKVAEGDRPAEQAEGVTFLRRQGDRMVYSVESGAYRFVVEKYR